MKKNIITDYKKFKSTIITEAVYREGYHIIDELKKASVQIYPDAADYGVPVKKGDKYWKMAQQLVTWYGVDKSR